MMRNNVRFVLAACLAPVMMHAVLARAADKSSGVVSAIEKKYVVTETTGDGEQVTKDGTTMAMKCAGVYSLPTSAFLKPDIKVEDGKVQKMNAFASAAMSNQGAHVLQTGDKVYVTKIESKSDSKNDQLKFTLLTLDSLDVKGSDAKKKFQATVTFKFKKGYLDEAPPEEVEQAIESVVAPDTGSDDAKGGAQAQGQQQAAAQAPAPPAQRAAPAPAPVAAAPAGPPPTISIGESSTQVLQAMGMPLQMIDLGKKKTFIYKDMKIIFVDDKVSDMQ
jgi:hypothetical protein